MFKEFRILNALLILIQKSECVMVAYAFPIFWFRKSEFPRSAFRFIITKPHLSSGLYYSRITFIHIKQAFRMCHCFLSFNTLLRSLLNVIKNIVLFPQRTRTYFLNAYLLSVHYFNYFQTTVALLLLFLVCLQNDAIENSK